MTLSRRRLLAEGTAVAGVSLAFQGSLSALFTGTAAAAPPKHGYGPLVEDPAGVLDLPRGFTYRILSQEGDELRSGEGLVPSRADGMGVFGRGVGRPADRLVRNHECHPSAPHHVPRGAHTYDPEGAGGTTTLVLGPRGKLAEEYVSLSGSAVNCAGGETPWHTWLTCEETEKRAGEDGYTKDHGFIFEIDPFDRARNADPVPLTAMGRYPHEAIAVDPQSGRVYETEDSFDHPFGLFYRFSPAKPMGGYGSLRAGGLLEAMRVPGVADLSTVTEAGTEFDDVEWVEVPDPLAASEGIRFQDFAGGAMTHSQKLEGCWWGQDGVYFSASFAKTTDGSEATHDGQIWHYQPDRNLLRLAVIFRRGPDTAEDQLFQTPDNICVSPYGGLMVCEDGDGENYVIGVTEAGDPYLFARNRQNVGTADQPSFAELTGVSFADNGRTMYVNCYNPGTTFAITGTWRRR